ncbi:hypothetical protein [Methanohalophilus sp. DAL1]|uniref:hypothetical protein n=1 Tax=Methanohalophilus sp. DAL1 TaxID=1864608 RepID=UPI00081763B6|nr:hypothetical protein [Methanohalophilus sp. DAL1]OBZ36046.1 MAG: hypothetical protein A9957_04695 [Methanohalophilus sp. DAL1]
MAACSLTIFKIRGDILNKAQGDDISLAEVDSKFSEEITELANSDKAYEKNSSEYNYFCKYIYFYNSLLSN